MKKITYWVIGLLAFFYFLILFNKGMNHLDIVQEQISDWLNKIEMSHETRGCCSNH